MKSNQVIAALGALAHEHRLAVYRLLVTAGPEGLPAGSIADRIRLVPSSLTFHLQNLQRAGLITQRREGRQLIYSTDFGAMNARRHVPHRELLWRCDRVYPMRPVQCRQDTQVADRRLSRDAVPGLNLNPSLQE